MESSGCIVSKLSHHQRTLLVEHVKGAQQIDHGDYERQKSVIALLNRNLLRGHPYGVRRPRETVLTELGRECVSILLSSYADALVSAGWLEASLDGAPRPFQILQRLKAQRKAAVKADPAEEVIEAAPALTRLASSSR